MGGRPQRGAGVTTADEQRLQVLLRAPLEDRQALSTAMKALKSVRSARKERDSVTIRIDPTEGIG